MLAVFATIFVSAFVHEYLLALALRFASPVLLMEFAGLGGIKLSMVEYSCVDNRQSNYIMHMVVYYAHGGLNFAETLTGSFYSYAVLFYLMEPFKKRRISNLFVLFCLSVGGANLVFYYQVELAARLYCPREVGP